MPSTLETPVLQVDANVIHKVDTSNPQNLFSMWTVFARCADSVHQGRRLENLSWRLWTRETFCCEGGNGPATTPAATSLPRDIQQPRRSSAEDMPQLSGSLDSVEEEEAVEFSSDAAPVDILRPRIRRQDSCASSRSRGRERHITSDDLEKMVVSIVEQKEPFTAPLPDITPSYPTPETEKVLETPPTLERSGSTTTESPCKTSDTPSESSQQPDSPELPTSQSRTTIVRGFSPSQLPPAQAFTTISKPAASDVIPEPSSSPAAKFVQPKKTGAKFALGGSSGSGEESYSDHAHSLEVQRRLPVPQPQPKRKMFQVGGSSEEDSSLRSALASSHRSSLLNAQKKQTSFANQVITRTIPSAVIDEDNSDDYVDESAIDDDDDSSDWEDSIEDSGKSSIDEKTFFQRVDSKPNLTSRRSLITLMLEQGDRSKKLGNTASQSTSALHGPRSSLHRPTLVASPNDSDEAPLMMKRGMRQAPLRPINEVPRSAAQPIMTTTNNIGHQAALSPRTTRRNMLSTELTESLRRHLVWERSQKSSTANAVLKRRHTSHDVANLKQYPEVPYMNRADNDVNASSWDQYFAKEAFSGYHSKGW